MFPAYTDIEEPLLVYIFLRGGSGREVASDTTYRPLADYFRLADHERTQPRKDRDEPEWNNMVQWARRKLNDHGYLAVSRRGRWKLSEAGVNAATKVAEKYRMHWR